MYAVVPLLPPPRRIRSTDVAAYVRIMVDYRGPRIETNRVCGGDKIHEIRYVVRNSSKKQSRKRDG